MKKDCGACPIPVCGDGRCDLLEAWAPRTGEYTSDLGYRTCPEDCLDAQATCGNHRCEANEVCRSQTPQSCSADCCADFGTLLFLPCYLY